eukprot:CAMPEP_0114972614 /NCGR_PEP_ID=MMETSP0216-20121206/493_1 /TAXON_ID=223996 /ORGANISM="Protocruzia adherens, Strain Boccale" /LENGTH=851 /DNA_ID=CAMNT_0002333007 /DNA_START=396 /DNA_END=2951 /DNA_ORIENTATION=+
MPPLKKQSISEDIKSVVNLDDQYLEEQDEMAARFACKLVIILTIIGFLSFFSTIIISGLTNGALINGFLTFIDILCYIALKNRTTAKVARWIVVIIGLGVSLSILALNPTSDESDCSYKTAFFFGVQGVSMVIFINIVRRNSVNFALIPAFEIAAFTLLIDATSGEFMRWDAITSMVTYTVIIMFLAYEINCERWKNIKERKQNSRLLRAFRDLFLEAPSGMLLWGDQTVLLANKEIKSLFGSCIDQLPRLLRLITPTSALEHDQFTSRMEPKSSERDFCLDSKMDTEATKPCLLNALEDLQRDLDQNSEPSTWEGYDSHIRLGEFKLFADPDCYSTATSATAAATNDVIVEIGAGFVHWEGSVCILLTFKDITSDKIYLNSLREVDNLKSTLLRTVSHDVRAPLNGIQSALDSLVDCTSASKRLEFISIAQTSSAYLNNLIHDISDYFQLKSGGLRMINMEFDIQDVITSSVSLLKNKAMVKDIEIIDEIQENTPTTVVNDPSRFQQVLINLLSNAIKFSDIGSEVKIIVHREDDDFIGVQIIDFGLGIPEDRQSQLFKEFGTIRTDESSRRNPAGIGLGLWISKRICKLLGKGIHLESIPLKGSTFSFTLATKNPLTEGSVLTESILTRQTNSKKILKGISEVKKHLAGSETRPSDRLGLLQGDCELDCSVNESSCKMTGAIDDEQLNILSLKSMLTRRGLTCDSAFNGKMALDKIIQRQNDHAAFPEYFSRHYRLIIVDYQMDQMNGPEFLIRLRNLLGEPEYLTLRICGYTGYEREEVDEFFRLGAIDVLPKPVASSHLNRIVSLLSEFQDVDTVERRARNDETIALKESKLMALESESIENIIFEG